MPSRWPNPDEYDEAVQDPSSFADPDLRAATVAVDNNGMPIPCSGTFAVVYQFNAVDRKKNWAVKCFTKSVARLKERYREISLCLEQAQLSMAVEFHYLEEGIRIQGEWYPVLKMDWVEGQTLRQFVLKNLDKPRLLESLYQVWLKVEPQLANAQLAHGDLQHGNVMLVPGDQPGRVLLRLIDYDGMWVPNLITQPPPEVGHPAYQHPQRAKQNLYTTDVDRFPNLVIACALKCLARSDGPDIWKKFDNGDNLLFKNEDFDSPANSELLHQIWETGDSELQAWAGQVALAATSPLEATPRLSNLLRGGALPPLSRKVEADARRVLGYSPRPAMNATAASNWSNDWLDEVDDADATEPQSVSQPEPPRPLPVSAPPRSILPVSKLPVSAPSLSAPPPRLLAPTPLSSTRPPAVAWAVVVLGVLAIGLLFSLKSPIWSGLALIAGSASLLSGVLQMELELARFQRKTDKSLGRQLVESWRTSKGIAVVYVLLISPFLTLWGPILWTYGAVLALGSRFQPGRRPEEWRLHRANLRFGWWSLNLSGLCFFSTVYMFLWGTADTSSQTASNTGTSVAESVSTSTPVPNGVEAASIDGSVTLREVTSWGDNQFEQQVDAVALSPDGRRVAIYRRGAPVAERISLWDVDTGIQLARSELTIVPIPLSQSSDPKLCFTDDGKVLVVASTGVLESLLFKSSISSGSEQPWLARRGRWLFAVDANGLALELWDLDVVRRVRAYRGPGTRVLGICFTGSEAGSVVTAAGNVIEYDLSTGLERRNFSCQQSNQAPPQRVVFSEDGQRLVEMTETGTSSVWDVIGGKRLCSVTAEHNDVLLSPDGRHVVYWPNAQTCVVADANKGNTVVDLKLRSPHLKRGNITSHARGGFAAEGGRFVSLSRPNLVRVFEVDMPQEGLVPTDSDLWYGESPQPGKPLNKRVEAGALVQAGAYYCLHFPDGLRALNINLSDSKRRLTVNDLTTGVVLRQFDDLVYAARVSSDGRRLALAASPMTSGQVASKLVNLAVYDTRSWELLQSVPLPVTVAGVPSLALTPLGFSTGPSVISVTFSPDGLEVVAFVRETATVVSTTKDGQTREVALNVGANGQLKTAIDGNLVAVHWNRDDEWLLISANGTLRAIDARRGALKRQYAAVPEKVSWAVFSDDGQLALVMPEARTVGPRTGKSKPPLQLVETRNSSLLAAVGADLRNIVTAVIAPDKDCALLGDSDGQMLLWDLYSEKMEAVDVDKRSAEGLLAQLHKHPGGNSGWARYVGGSVYTWTLKGRQASETSPVPPPSSPANTTVNESPAVPQPVTEVAAHADGLIDVAVSRDGQKVASIDRDGILFVSGLKNPLKLKTAHFVIGGPHAELAFSASDAEVLVLNPTVGLYVVQLAKRKVELVYPRRQLPITRNKRVAAAAAANAGIPQLMTVPRSLNKDIILADAQGRIYRFNTQTKNVSPIKLSVAGPAKGLACNDSADAFIVTDSSNTFAVNLNSGIVEKHFVVGSNQLSNVNQLAVFAVSSNGRRMLGAYTLDYSFVHADLEASMGVQNGPLVSYARFAVSTNVLKVPSSKEIIRALAVSPDGDFAVSGGEESGLIRIWDLDLGEQIGTLEGNTKAVTCLAFSPDGQSLISGGDDKKVRKWNLTSVLSKKAKISVVESNAPNLIPRPQLKAGEVPLIEVWGVLNSVTQIVKTDPKETISKHGVALSVAQRQTLERIDGQHLAGLTYQLFVYPNRGPMQITWTGIGRPTFRLWRQGTFTPISDAPIGPGRKTVTVPINIDTKADTVYLMVVDGNSGEIKTDAIKAHVTSGAPKAANGI